MQRALRIVHVKASPSVAAKIALVDGEPHVFLANFKGLIANQNPVQSPNSMRQSSSKDIPGILSSVSRRWSESEWN